MEWQPIETAPMDGTIVDLWLVANKQGYRYANCWWCPDRKTWANAIGDFEESCATYWMPLPEPPNG
jgi:hypothetical protein